MKVAKVVVPASVVALALFALLGSVSMASAQGAAVDTPSGYGLISPIVEAPEFGGAVNLTPTQKLGYLLAQSFGPLRLRSTRWSKPSRQTAGTAAVSRTAAGVPSRSWTLPAGR